ncbi:50S ribosomal protein L5 [Patescibacteria group bacterium]|nr:50S ribosomal protein L5 [Patescibacteria group bacterium]
MNLREKYEKKVITALMQKFDYSNKMAVPKIEKVVINTGFGKLVANKTGDDLRKTIAGILTDTSSVAGQHAVVTLAKKSIAGFKLREGVPMGAKVTLRGQRMYDFLERLVNIVLPRSRDFQGISASSVDEEGNLTLGIKEHIFFPEISPEKIRNMFGLEVSIVNTAKNREEGLELFQLLGFPFQK